MLESNVEIMRDEDAALSELRLLGRAGSALESVSNEIIPGSPGEREIGEAEKRISVRMKALAAELLAQPCLTIDDVERRAEAGVLCWPSLIDDGITDGADPRDAMVAALLLNIMGAVGPKQIAGS